MFKKRLLRLSFDKLCNLILLACCQTLMRPFSLVSLSMMSLTADWTSFDTSWYSFLIFNLMFSSWSLRSRKNRNTLSPISLWSFRILFSWSIGSWTLEVCFVSLIPGWVASSGILRSDMLFPGIRNIWHGIIEIYMIVEIVLFRISWFFPINNDYPSDKTCASFHLVFYFASSQPLRHDVFSCYCL